MSDTLILFDIDGTLVWRASREHAVAVLDAVEAVHGVRPQLGGIDVAGRTDRAIVRQLLRASGIDEATIDAGMDDVLRRAAEHYETGCPPDLSSTVLPGVPALLDELAAAGTWALGLVTGNIEQVAHRKLTAAGLHGQLQPFVGAYGSDHEDRNALVPIAQQRATALHGAAADAWQGARTIVVGDTPHDIACARAAGAAVIAVTTGAFAEADLGAADAVVHDSDQLAAALLQLAAKLD